MNYKNARIRLQIKLEEPIIFFVQLISSYEKTQYYSGEIL